MKSLSIALVIAMIVVVFSNECSMANVVVLVGEEEEAEIDDQFVANRDDTDDDDQHLSLHFENLIDSDLDDRWDEFVREYNKVFTSAADELFWLAPPLF